MHATDRMPDKRADPFSLMLCRQPGDKLLYVSASFGPDVWEAKNFGQVMYAVRTRNGGLYFKLLKRNGDLSIFEVRRHGFLNPAHGLYLKLLKRSVDQGRQHVRGAALCTRNPVPGAISLPQRQLAPSQCGIKAGVRSASHAMDANMKDTCCTAPQEEELSDAQKRFQMEKAGGNYGMGTKEMQVRHTAWHIAGPAATDIGARCPENLMRAEWCTAASHLHEENGSTAPTAGFTQQKSAT